MECQTTSSYNVNMRHYVKSQNYSQNTLIYDHLFVKKKKKKERKKERKKEKGKLMWTYSLYLNTSWVILCTPNLRNNSLRPQVFLNHFGMTTYILSLLGYFYLFIFFHSVMAIFPLKSILGLYLNFCCIFLNTS